MSRSTDKTLFLVRIWFIVLALVAAGLWMWFQWGECRNVAGLSFWYCVQHIA